MKRAVFGVGLIILCAWTIVPIYLLALGALGGSDVVYVAETVLAARLVGAQLCLLPGDRRHLAGDAAQHGVAVLCMIFSIALGAPAGYALARFAFRSANTYRLLILVTRVPVSISRCRSPSPMCGSASMIPHSASR